MSDNIPVAFTLLAEQMTCGMLLFLLRERCARRQLILTAALTALFDAGMLFWHTTYLPSYLWSVHMLLLIGSVVLIIHSTIRPTAAGLYFYSVKSFLIAEFIASLEWQISYFYRWHQHLPFAVQLVLAGLIYAACLTLFFLIERQNGKPYRPEGFSASDFILVTTVAVVVFLLSNLGFLAEDTILSGTTTTDVFLNRTLFDLAGIMILYAFQWRVSSLELQLELSRIERYLEGQYQRYQNYPDTIELINMKYHDISHQLEDIKRAETAKDRRLLIENIESELRAYAPTYETGNQMLDAVLEIHHAKCLRSGTAMTVVADGSQLSFLAAADLCALFGNALDNAAEAVSEIPDPERRLIHIEVAAQKGFVRILVENSCCTDVVFRDQLPVPRHPDRREHGWGTRSIRHIAHKYGGEAVFRLEEQCFLLQILLPRKME